jgi:glycosyltransferase involved in cell wall biosynthesis
MVGRQGQRVTCQGQIISELFEAAGYIVTSTSAKTRRYQRLLDIIWTLIRKKRTIDVTVVEVYSGLGFVLVDVASWLARLLNYRLVLWLHGGALPAFMERHPVWSHRVLSRAHMMVAPSPYLADAVNSRGFQASLIPNVIDLSLYEYRHRTELRPRLMWMRSFHPTWNPDMAVRVLALLKTAIPDATLVMAGKDKGLEHEIRLKTENLRLDGCVRFAGFLDQNGKMHEGNQADIFINTNHIDNAPVAVLEACAMGLPVVSTNVGGIPNLLTDGETALLVPDDDDVAMAGAIRSLLNEPALAARLSAQGRLLAERSSWQEVRPQWERVFSYVMRPEFVPNRKRPDQGKTQQAEP